MISYFEGLDDRRELERQRNEAEIAQDHLRKEASRIPVCPVTTMLDVEVASGANAALTTEFTPLDHLVDRLSEFYSDGWTMPWLLASDLRHILREGDQYPAEWLTLMIDYVDQLQPRTLILVQEETFGSFRQHFLPRPCRTPKRRQYVAAINRQEICPDGPSIDEIIEQLIAEGEL